MNTLRHMHSITGYEIMARRWGRSYSCLQVADAMLIRLRLDRFDYEALDDEDRRRYDALREMVDRLATPP